MKIIGLIDEDIVNYKKCSMYIAFPKCDFKCGKDICQNASLINNSTIDIPVEEVCQRYLKNPLTSAVVLGGLEPFDTPFDLMSFIDCLRNKYKCDDDIVIYTGYTEDEFRISVIAYLAIVFQNISKYPNIIIKFGRYEPNQEPHFDEVLGVKLASDNQYGKRVSDVNLF